MEPMSILNVEGRDVFDGTRRVEDQNLARLVVPRVERVMRETLISARRMLLMAPLLRRFIGA